MLRGVHLKGGEQGRSNELDGILLTIFRREREEGGSEREDGGERKAEGKTPRHFLRNGLTHLLKMLSMRYLFFPFFDIDFSVSAVIYKCYIALKCVN